MNSQYKYTCSSDTVFVAKARALQNAYRMEHQKKESGWECGPGPYANSTVCYGNILLNGEETGHNFLCTETFDYAKYRVKNKHKNETIAAYRLYCNMLSSQPMAFNLFHPLMRMLEDSPTKEMLENVLRMIFPKLNLATVYSIGLEYLPVNSQDYLGDKTAMDAVIRYLDAEGNRNFIAVETKYTDKLGTNEASQQCVIDRAKSLVEELGQFVKAPKKYSQLYRNYLLAESVRKIGDKWGPYKDCYTWILSPKNHPSTMRETKILSAALKPEYRYKVNSLAGVSLEDFVDALIHVDGMPLEYFNLFTEFRKRYLDGLTLI